MGEKEKVCPKSIYQEKEYVTLYLHGHHLIAWPCEKLNSLHPPQLANLGRRGHGYWIGN